MFAEICMLLTQHMTFLVYEKRKQQRLTERIVCHLSLIGGNLNEFA